MTTNWWLEADKASEHRAHTFVLTWIQFDVSLSSSHFLNHFAMYWRSGRGGRGRGSEWGRGRAGGRECLPLTDEKGIKQLTSHKSGSCGLRPHLKLEERKEVTLRAEVS